MLSKNGIKYTYSTTRNPQSNGIIERVHQAIAHTLRTLVQLRPPQRNEDAEEIMKRSLAAAMQATRICSNSRLQNYSPAALVFGRDMFLDIPIVADIISITEARQMKIDKRLIYENRKRRFHDYKVGDQVMCRTARKSKVNIPYTGPHVIETVHTNGTVTIRRGPNVRDRINVRQVKPAK